MKTIIIIAIATMLTSFQLMAQTSDNTSNSGKEKKKDVKAITANKNEIAPMGRPAPCTLTVTKQQPKVSGPVIRFVPGPAPSPK